MKSRSLYLNALLLSCSISMIDAGKAKSLKALRQWESTGIVNSTGPVFACDNDSTRTINLAFRCDGEAHCNGGSDEQKCTECKTPFSRTGKNGFLECIRAEDMQQKTEKVNKYQRARPSDWNALNVTCSGDEFFCPHSKLCIPSRHVCDGIDDCLTDSADEKNCTMCNNGAKMCKSGGICVARHKLCDGSYDCSDGDDEENCTIETCRAPERALCGNGRCIGSNYVCDGVMDCEDASDEQGCPTSCGAVVNASIPLPTIVECRKDYYHETKRYLLSEVCSGNAPECDHDELCNKECDTRTSFYCPPYANHWGYYEHITLPGKCIPKAKVCDGQYNCHNGEDEQNCLQACKTYPHFMRVNKGEIMRQKSKCISMDSRCDGVFDFANKIDEKRCAKCASMAFQCDGGCISLSSRCDGVKDCQDGADEKNCSCEECTSGHLDTYSCEATRTCLQRSEACGPHSLCPRPTARDESFCIGHARRTMTGSKV